MVDVVKIVCNSSPLIFLARLGFLEKAIATLEHIYLPKAVAEEIEAKQDDASLTIKQLIASHRLEVKEMALISLARKLQQHLGRGEAHAIALAVELQANFIFLDDAAARKEATRLGLNVKGTLAVVRKLQDEEKICIPDLDAFYQQLLMIQFRLKRKLFEEIFENKG